MLQRRVRRVVSLGVGLCADVGGIVGHLLTGRSHAISVSAVTGEILNHQQRSWHTGLPALSSMRFLANAIAGRTLTSTRLTNGYPQYHR